MRFLIKVILISIMILSTILLGLLGSVYYGISTPRDPNTSDTSIIIIERGTSFNNIARQLEEEGIISSAVYFKLYGLLERKTANMQAGVYELSPAMNMRTVMEIISGGKVAGGERVTFPEGFTTRQIADRLVEAGVLEDGSEFLNLVEMSAASAYTVYGYSFLNEISADSLHGFLFPDTYEFQTPQEPRDVLDKFLANFEQKTSNLFSKRGSGQAANYSPYEILILASILEKEVQTEQDMKIAAGVLYNRLDTGMLLQVDASLVHITGKQTGELTNTDKQIDHPFNTYVYQGLTPAPISNPGLRAINAALDPEPNEYLYYLSAEDGTTIFSRTLEEHNENRVKYLDYLRR